MINLIPMPLSITESLEVYSMEKKNASAFVSKELEGIYDMLPLILGCEFRKAKDEADICFIYDDAEEILDDDAYVIGMGPRRTTYLEEKMLDRIAVTIARNNQNAAPQY